MLLLFPVVVIYNNLKSCSSLLFIISIAKASKISLVVNSQFPDALDEKEQQVFPI